MQGLGPGRDLKKLLLILLLLAHPKCCVSPKSHFSLRYHCRGFNEHLQAPSRVHIPLNQCFPTFDTWGILFFWIKISSTLPSCI